MNATTIVSLWRNRTRTTVAAVALFALAVGPARAATFTVDRTDDAPSAAACTDAAANDCSLRGAVLAASAGAGPNTVVVPPGNYVLSTVSRCTFKSFAGTDDVFTSALCLVNPITVTGTGAATTTIDGGGTDEVFMVSQGATAAISGVTIADGYFNRSSLWGQGGAINNAGGLTLDGCEVRDSFSAGPAGAIYNSGTLAIRSSTLDGNTANGDGGAIFNHTSSSVDIVDSTLSRNSSASGGGGVMNTGGTVTVTGSTISDNSGASYAGGLWNSSGSLVVVNSTISGNSNFHSYGGGVYNTGTAALRNVTITDNHAGATGNGGLGGGIAHLGGTLQLGNSIIAGNTASYFSAASAGPDCDSFPITSLGHNLIGVFDANCEMTGDTASNVVNVDAKLGTLVDDGGPTATHALLPGSPAVDAGDPAAPGSGGTSCTAFDQRGFPRPTGARCDIGAFEQQLGFAVNAVTPTHGGDAGAIVTHVAGNAFDDAATVRLRRAGQPDIVGTPVTIDGAGTGISTAFDLTGAVLGAWDVVVDNPGASATLPGAFTVEGAGQPDLWVSVIGPRAFRAGRPTPFQIVYGNRGNVDALAVPLTLAFGPGVEFLAAFPLALPPVQAGQLALEWLLQDLTVDVGPDGATNVPLLLPIVPAGFSGSLEVTLTLPPEAPHGTEFTTLASLGTPLLTPLPDPAAIATSVAGAQAYASANFDYTLPDTLTPALTAYAEAQLAAVVADGRARLIADIGAAPAVSNLAWLGIDLALFGTGQVLLPDGPIASLAAGIRSLGTGTAFAQTPPQSPLGTVVCPVRACKDPSGRAETLVPGCTCTDIKCNQTCVKTNKDGLCIEVNHECFPPPIPLPKKCDLAGEQTVAQFLENLKHCKITEEHCRALPNHDVVTSDDGSVFCVPTKTAEHCPKIAIPNPGGAGALDCIATPIKLASDPNDKTGVMGAGVTHAVAPGTPLAYTIDFENDPAEANAPAQVVTVTDQLDPSKVDLATFSLGPISFGSIQVPMPPGTQSYHGGVDLRPAQNLLVLISAALDPDTGLVGWEFTSVDPDTQQLTTDANAGFLPPDVTPPEGEGVVAFTVKPKDDLADGVAICNQASIVFDVNAAIATPQWCNTVDHTPPTSAVAALPATSPQSIGLTWSGSDAGAGIADYTIYVSTDGGPFTAFLTDTEDTQATFQGQIGSSYAFYSVARDLVGNEEQPPASPDAHTMVVATGTASDLAITKLTVPKIVTLTAKKPSVGKTVTVQIQNRSAHAETIPDAATAARLVQVSAQSLGACPAPAVTLRARTIKKPIVVKPKRKASLFFDVTFDCASFPGKSSKKTPGLEDDRFTATVTLSALGGDADAHPIDDVCPRQVTPPGLVDPFPDGTILDKGCGTRRPDKTFGDPVLTDVVDRAPQ